MKKAYPDAINSYRDIFTNAMEIDIFVPSLKIGIEYDGEMAHQGSRRKKDVRKYQVCKNNDVFLIRVREILDLHYEELCDVQLESRYTTSNQDRLHSTLAELKTYLPLLSDFDITRDQIEILEMIKSELDARSLESECPDLVKEWNYEKNGSLTPKMFFSGNGDKVWWRCARGHEWKAAIHPRTKGIGCPICSNKQVLAGFNDLATTDPKIAMEWDYDKNGSFTPSEVTRSVSKKVWWTCCRGHNYPMRIDHRTSGHGCPYCSSSKAIAGENDFATLYPELLKEWDYIANSAINPIDYLPGSEKKVYWICSKCGNTWLAMIANRVKGSGCPECGKVLANQNAIKARLEKGQTFQNWCKNNNKEYLLGEWDKSNSKSPDDVTPKSYEKILWNCSKCGYHYTAEVFRRAGDAVNCPVCLNRVAITGYNDLETLYPNVAAEWCYELNGKLKPSQVTAGNSQIVWWNGKCGHKWEAKIGDRARGGNGCPYCAGARILKGFNDLETKNPKLALEWDYDKNDIKPDEVSPGSHKKVFWRCKKGHSWEAEVKSRNSGVGCPYCAKEKKEKRDS